MLESHVIALAGVFQACQLVRVAATSGRFDPIDANSSLASVFRFDADSAVDVFGGLQNARDGLIAVLAQLDAQQERDLHLTQLAVSVLRMERKLSARPDLLSQLRNGIEGVQQRGIDDGAATPKVVSGLATVYSQTLSTLRPRITVHGDPQQLNQEVRVEQIRALLLAATRAAVLWHQVGGRQWSLLLRRRQYAMLARGMLARCTIDRGA
ncbi:MAG: high frequency lysogenization protein HflD [Dokdonella sp.]